METSLQARDRSVIRSIHEFPPISPSETLSLRSGIVDLWCFAYGDIDEPSLFACYDELVSSEERARHRRFHCERERRLFLATRGLVRTVLSNYAQVAPADWRFATSQRGKPHISTPAVAPSIHFNLSHTPGLITCAVTVAHDMIGVDAECIDRPGEVMRIADRHFAIREARRLRSLPPEQQRRQFFSYWTLKESYVKATGLGLALPLNRFALLLDDGPDIGIAFDQQPGSHPSRWRFALIAASSHHVVAVCADTAGAPLSLRAVSNVPLRGLVAFEATGS